MCNSKRDNLFDDHGLRDVLYRLTTELKMRIDCDYVSVIEPGYHKILTGPLLQILSLVRREPFTHNKLLEAEWWLMTIKEPLKNMRFSVTESNTKMVLEVFALHELFNTIAKLIDTLHMFSHVEDQISLGELDFRNSIQKYLSLMFTQDVQQP